MRQLRSQTASATATLTAADEHFDGTAWPRIRAPKSARAAVATTAEQMRALGLPERGAVERERAAVVRIVQLHRELKARETALGNARKVAAAANKEAEALRLRLMAANRAAAERDKVARAGIVALRRELAARGAALVEANRRLQKMASLAASGEPDRHDSEAVALLLDAAE